MVGMDDQDDPRGSNGDTTALVPQIIRNGREWDA